MSSELYSRQSSLNLLHYNHAIIVGLGGVGNWVALDLALSGQVDCLHLIDPDTVEESNLNRTIFRYCDIGSHKVDATKYQILERRVGTLIKTYKDLTNPAMLNQIASEAISDPSVYDPNCLIMDCRDDIYDDLYDFNCKLYKIGYDGTSMTIDGNPRLMKVWTQRGGGYHVIPSYIGSSQIVAAIAVNDALGAGIVDDDIKTRISDVDVAEMPFIRNYTTKNGRDEYGRLNCCVTFGCQSIIQNCSAGNVSDYNKEDVITVLKDEKDNEDE